MQPAICTSFDYGIPFPEVISMIGQAGFRVIGLGANPRHSGYCTRGGRAEIRKLIKDSGISVDSVHAPFPEGDRLFSLDKTERECSVRQCLAALDAAAELDGAAVVVHLIQPYGIPHGEVRDKMIARGFQSIGALADAAAQRGVKLALENGQRRDYDEVLEALLAEFQTPHVGLCYDSGHENVQGACFQMLERYLDRLLKVHIHDNRGSDTHNLPYEGSIDWDGFRKVFHGREHSSSLLLEVTMKDSGFDDPHAFLARAKAVAEELL